MRVLLADDQPEIRSAMRLLLDQELGVAVVGSAGDVGALLSLAGDTHPDVILLDWELPEGIAGGQNRGSASSLVATLRGLSPQVSIIALSVRPESRAFAMEAGADAFVSKGDPPERLLEVIRCSGSPSPGVPR